MTAQVWPVIHVNHDMKTSLENAHIAWSQGCEGVFLIQMQGRDEMLEPIYHHLRSLFPELKVGFNFLSLSGNPGRAMQKSLDLGADATWSDNPGVRSDGIALGAIQVSALLTEHPEHLFFGSVAFKYQPEDPDPKAAAEVARNLNMIPTTSGVATGQAPSVEKLKGIQDGQHHPLALASGVTPENVAELAPYLSHILVSTGITNDFESELFDHELLKQLIENLPEN